MKRIIFNKDEWTRVFLDFYYWTSIILFNNFIVFHWNWHAKDIVLPHINSNNFNSYWLWYLEGKLAQYWATKKDIKFYIWMVEHYHEERERVSS